MIASIMPMACENKRVTSALAGAAYTHFYGASPMYSMAAGAGVHFACNGGDTPPGMQEIAMSAGLGYVGMMGYKMLMG